MCRTVEPTLCELLGAPVGVNAVTACLNRRTEFLRSLKDRLKKIDRHDAIALLRTSLGHPRAIYDLCAGACFRSTEALEDFDGAVRDAFSEAACVA